MRKTLAQREAKALFRARIVEQVIHLPPAERSQRILELSQQEHQIPDSQKTSISQATIYRWIKKYTSGDPYTQLRSKARSDRNTYRKLTKEQQCYLLLWRGEGFHRTGEDLLKELACNDQTKHLPLPSLTTVLRFLREQEMDRRAMRRKVGLTKTRLPFEADYPNQIWQADTKGCNIQVENPHNPSELVDAVPIVILDDHSRYVVGLRYVLEENSMAVLSVFQAAVQAYGVPWMLYTDLGSPYRARAIQRAASLIGCYVHHTEVRDPQAKGKVERIMQQFTNRLELELQAIGKPPTLAELNEYAVAYVEVEYHQRRHSTTGESPHDRYNRLPMESRRLISADTLALVFLPCETAKVSTDGIIRFNKSRYLVPASLLRNKQVEIRYDPEDLSRLHVWYADKYHGEATLYAANNDYQFRESVWSEEEVPAPVTTDKHLEVPYTRMQRIIDEYRRDQQVMAKDIDEELAHSRASGHMMQATSVVPHGPSSSDVFGLAWIPTRTIGLTQRSGKVRFALGQGVAKIIRYVYIELFYHMVINGCPAHSHEVCFCSPSIWPFCYGDLRRC